MVMITLDKGSKDGVVPQMRFDLVRYGETLGKLEVVEVGPDSCTGKLLFNYKEVVQGDDARTGKRRIKGVTNMKDRAKSEK